MVNLTRNVLCIDCHGEDKFWKRTRNDGIGPYVRTRTTRDETRRTWSVLPDGDGETCMRQLKDGRKQTVGETNVRKGRPGRGWGGVG